MKKIWLGIGAAVIVILLLLQTKFNVFMRLEQNGYAVADSEIKKMLMLDPEEVELETSFEHYRFEALDYIYQRGNKYYMGEKKKQEIDLGFPLYVNGGAGILFTDNSGTLFDVDFETAETYPGLTVSEGISYNPGGSRADATEYIFSELPNGMFVNLDVLTFKDRGEERNVDPNSIIYFTEEYFTYSEQQNGIGNYQVCKTIAADDIVNIHGQEITYHDLLLKLHVINEKKAKEPEVEEETTPVETLVPEQAELEDGEVLESEVEGIEEAAEKEDATKELQEPAGAADKEVTKEEEQKQKQPQQGSQSNSKPNPGSPSAKPQNPVKPPSSDEPPRGTRPDSMRPDKETAKPVVGYIKPNVTVNSVTAGVYRIMLDVTVDDPAIRLHKLRKVQFEFYEVGSDGKETLVYRTYTGASNSKLSAGEGSIKPDTTYRINAYFTYYDEYDNMTVESIPLDTLIPDSKITTGSLSSVGIIDLGNPVPQYYYDTYLELPNVKYAAGSDEEALYGINRNAGMKLIVKGNSGFSAETILDATTIRNFKNGVSVDFVSAANLTPKSEYEFTIVAEDYFGNSLTLINNTGTFETCKSRPIGSLEIVENKLGNFKMRVKMTDLDESAIPATTEKDYDIYLVYATERSEVEKVTKEECDAYLAGTPINGSKVAFVHKFEKDTYLKDGRIEIDQIIETTKLDLNERYFAYLYCDYDLNNKKGPVYFGEIADLKFTSASLSSLGDIYVKVDISHVMAHSATITYTLNTDRTVDELEKLLSSVRFNIVRDGGEEEITDSYIEFNTDAMTKFTGYDHGTNENPKDFPWSPKEPVSPEDSARSVLMDASFFDGSLSEEQHALNSMTDYSIDPVIKATYNGKEYDMKVKLTTSSFKTMKEPASVEVENLVLAAGRLRFNVKINDPDEAIMGNSGHMVRMNLYQQDGTFVKAIRIPKNTEDFQEIEIAGLKEDKRFKLTFIATEYNEGYTNSTYVSNKIIKEILIDDSVELSGTIKLQDIVAGDSNSRLKANVAVSLNDDNKILNNGCYYIKVTKNGIDVTESANYPASYEVPGTGGYYIGTGTKIEKELTFAVDKGRNTYQLTLYAMVNGQQLILDTLKFTAEKTVTAISSAEDFIFKIKNDPSGKFVVTEDIVLDSETVYENPNDSSQKSTPKRITNNFNGQIDFQGYSLDYNYRSKTSSFFANLGSQSEISNMVFNVKLENSGAAVYDDGILCRFNYGKIHDVMVNFKGAVLAMNEQVGLLCKTNTVSGVIENFVVSNEPEEGMMPYTVWKTGGLVCASNLGIVRNGYAYGDPIYTDIAEPSVGGELQVGGIVGFQSSRGRLENVFSLVNVSVANPHRALNQNTKVNGYGSIAGRAYGKVFNAYGIGESFYREEHNNETKNIAVGPAVGTFDGRSSNVYYWNETDTDYTNTKQKRIGLESLYDYGWQAELLGSQFNTSNVEVGYYPHVKLSDELPSQPNLPLPERASANLVEFVSAEVVEYVDNKQAAIVNFRFSNTQNAQIQEINIKELTTEIDKDSIHSADGFTNLQAKVYNPTRFCSTYEIDSVKCYLKGERTVDFEPNPILLVDFYRNISTPDEWYEYVVKQPTENARLIADIDFSGVPEDRIAVTSEYTGKLDGGSADENSPGYSIKNITIQQRKKNNVFTSNVRGAITNLCIENLTLGNEDNVVENPAFVNTLNGGVIDNVHIYDMNVIGYKYIGGIASTATYGAEITNSSIRNINLTYKEPENVNTVGRIGGVAAYVHETRVNNCYVRDLEMNVPDIRECEGAGGLVGYASSSSIDGAYSTGSITVRGVRAGGIVGYYTNNETGSCIKNILSGTDVLSYQDKIGGLVGEASVTAMLNDRNNMSGVALGNVFANDPDASAVSYTIGDMAGAKLSFYGSEVQLLNGLVGQEKDENTLGILTLEQIQDADTYMNEAGMDAVFDYSKAEDNYFPVLYYEGTNIPLPFQSDIPLSSAEISKNEITVNEVILNVENNRIALDVNTLYDTEYKITNIKIENLKLNDHWNNQMQNTLTDGGGRISTYYLSVGEQEHWQDSYLLTRIDYTKMVNGEPVPGYADFTEDPVRIPLTLFAEINSVEAWNQHLTEANNYGNYENYCITEDLNFANRRYTYNVKIGRIKGATGRGDGKATLSGIDLSGPRTNFIFRLNTEMTNLAFENCNITSSERDGVGLVGASAADVTNISFKGINISNKTQNVNTAGLVGYQVGGSMQDIIMEHVSVVGDRGEQSYVGGLVGYCTGSVLFKNINGTKIEVTGSSYVGGLVGMTARAYFEDIAYEDIKVTGRASYVGGIIGYNNSPRTAENAPHMWNVSIKGKPERDAAGWVIGSSTEIAIGADYTAGNYMGGIAGRCIGYNIGFGRPAGVEGGNAITVDGIVLRAAGSYVGGAFGESYGCQNVTVTDVLITGNNHTRAQLRSQVGGVSGRQNYENSYNEVNHIKIDVEDYRQVGLVSGYRVNNGSSYYCFAHNSDLKTTKTTRVKDTVWDVGGVFGRSDSASYYCGAYNCNILATGETADAFYTNVGGIVGYSAGLVNRCFYYAEPQSDTDPTANAAYKVQGGSYVGGVVGNLGSGGATLTYSNANVIADRLYAGGLVGYYNNAYTKSKVSGKDVYGYSGVYLRNSYFAGTVKAKSFAGGAIGANAMAVSSTVDPSHQKNGGRSTVVDAAAGFKSGSAMEREYTVSNLILAKTVSADEVDTNGKITAHAFCGTQDGFEGKANMWYDPSKENESAKNRDYQTSQDKAFRTLLFAGMKVGKTDGEMTELYNMTAKPEDKVPDYAKNGDQWRYEMWNPSEFDDANGIVVHWPVVNARLVTTADLQGANQYETLKALAWVTENNNAQPMYRYTMKGDYYRLFYSAIDNKAEWDAVGDAGQYQGKDYLPHIRVNSKKNPVNFKNDKFLQKQSNLGIALPIPEWTATTPRPDTTTLSLRPVAQTYVTIYPVDADRINVEFSQDLVDCGGYFTLSYGGEVISKQLITKRVYTYSYDYAKNLKLTYGYADLETIQEQMVQAGIIEADTPLTEEQEQKIFAYEDLIFELDTLSYSAASLERHVMVYGNEYYYISEDGIVHGCGSSSSSQSTGEDTSSEDGKVVDETAQTMAGSYITIYNGHALCEDGRVIEVSGEGTVRTTSGCAPLSEVTTLQSFNYDGYWIETYAKFSEVVNTDVVAKESQILKGYTGNVGFIDSRMENIKDSLLLYTKDGKEYQTILGVDGIMIDMFQGDDINAPEDFKCSGIVYMTNNLNSSVPFVLVEYQNGGIVGYNYMTGEYLFDNSVKNVMSLLDYTKVYFEGDKSMYAQVSSSYAVNKETAEIIGTPERLLELVEGNSENIDVQGNSTGEGTKSENELQEKAGDETAKTSNKTEVSESGEVSDKLTDGDSSSVQGDAKGDGKENDLDSNGEALNGASAGDNTLAESKDGTGESDNIEESEFTSVPGAESGNPVSEDEKISGEGKGEGINVVSGTSTANGSNTEITDSIGGVSGDASADKATGTGDKAAGVDKGTGNDSADDADDKVNIDELDISTLTGKNTEGEAGEGKDGEGEDGKTVSEVGKDVKENETDVANGQTDDAQDGANSQVDGTQDGANGGNDTVQTSAKTRTTTAGTKIKTSDNINNGDSNSPNLGTLNEEEKDEGKTESSDTSNTSSSDTLANGLITVYNQSTGTYEIVDVEQYFNIPVYQSENQKLCIHDLSAYAGFAEEEVEKEEADGLLLYILIAFAIVGGVGFTYYYRKKTKYNR